MIQAIGLTSLPRRHQLKPAVDDLTFEARPGRVTVLLGPEGSGKTTALRLMLQLETGRGTALFRGRPVHRIQHLAREVGVLLGEVNGHPGRTARGHLRMLSAAAGVPSTRADEVLDVVGLSGLADQRMSTYSRGMDRRLGMACALLGDPHTLVLDEPAHGLSPRETAWLYSLLRGYASQGGAVLTTSHTSDEAAELGDRIVSIDSGRLVADQQVADFVRTRLRPRVAVRTPHADRLVAVLNVEARKAGKERANGPIKVVREGGTRISVYGSSCAEVGEHAHRHGILVHQLTDERGATGDAHAPGPLDRADGRRSTRKSAMPDPQPVTPSSAAHGTRAVPGPPPGTGSGTEPVMTIEELDDFDVEPAKAAADSPVSADSERSSTPDSRAAAGSSGRKALSLPTDPQAPASEAPAVGDTDYRSESTSEREPESPSAHESMLVTTSAASLTRFAYGSTTSARAVTANSPAGTTESDSAGPALSQEAAAAKTTDAEGAVGPDAGSDPAPDVQAASATTSAEAPTLQLSDGPLVDPSTDAVTAPASGSDSDSGEDPSPTRPILMKPLADPDAPRKPKSPWTPKSPPARAAAELPPQLHAVARPGPAAPLRYELCRLASVRSTWIALAVTVVVALCVSLVMARTGLGLPSAAGDSLTPAVRLLTGWPSGDVYVLPPVAVAAGLLGAFAFGEEFRYPALAPARAPVQRRVSLLSAKLAVSATLAVLLGLTVAAVNAAAVTLFFGAGALSLPSDVTSASDGPWQLHVAAVFAFAIGCAWAGVLAAGIFRSGVIGTAVVVAVPLLLAPVVRTLLGDARHTTDGLPGRLEATLLMPWPPGTERWVAALVELASQPVGFALALTLAALLAGYLVTTLNSRAE